MTHARHMHRELQDATALATIVRCYEDWCVARASPFAADVILSMSKQWQAGTLTDRIRVARDEPIARRAQQLGLFTWRRGQRHQNRLPARRRAPA